MNGFQALNGVTGEEPNITCSNIKDYLDETSVYKDNYTLEHWPDDAEYMIPSRENTKFQGSTSESDKSELNITWMIPMQFFPKITHDKDSDEFRYIPTGDYVRLWDDRNVIYHEAARKCYQYHDATNSLMAVDVEHCSIGTRFLLCKEKC